MRFITLTESEIETLEQGARHHGKPYFRQRCESLLLSHRRYQVGQIAALFQTRTHTIRQWMDTWLDKGLSGLYIQAGRGRKATIKDSNYQLIDSIKAAIALNPQKLDAVALVIEQQWGIRLSKEQLKHFIKKNSAIVGDDSASASKSVKTRNNTSS
jgi:transposase